MADFSETQIVAAELERVEDKVATAFDRDTTFFGQIEKVPVTAVSARDARVPIEQRPGGNPGHFNPEGGSLGPGSGPTFVPAIVQVVYLKYGVTYTKKAEWATDSSRKAVVNSVRHLLATSVKEFRRFVDSLSMTSGNGIVGTITSFSTAGGKDTYVLSTDGFRTRLIRFAQFLAVYQSNLSASRTITPSAGAALDGIAAEVDLIDPTTNQVRIKGAAASVANGDVLVVNGLSGATPVSLLGVPYHHNDTGIWLNIDRSTNPEVRATKVNASNAALNLFHARLAMNKIGDRIGRDEMGDITAWAHPCQAQAYEELAQAVQIIQKTPAAEKINLFFGDNMQLAGAPLKTHFSWNRQRVDFFNKALWGRFEIKPAGFYTEEGRKLFEGRDSNGNVMAKTQFYMTVGMNLFHRNPIGAAWIDSLAIPTGW